MRLPVAAREIRVAAHDRASYRGRVWTTICAIFATLWILEGFLNFTGRMSSSIGAQLFSMQAWCAYLFACCAFGATADSISREKRDGTLGLLFLTHLKGRDVVLGKLASCMCLYFFCALATLPVMTLPILLGGIQWTQSINLLLSIFNCMLFAASAGLLGSAIHSDRNRAMSFGVGTVIVFCALIPIVVFALRHKRLSPDLCLVLELLSPFYAQRVSPGAMLGFQKTFLYISLALVFLLSCGMLAAASWIAPRTWQVREHRPIIQRLRKRFATWIDQTIPARSALGRRLLDRNAYEWLAARRKSASRSAWTFMAALLLLAVALTANFIRHNEPANVLILVSIPTALILCVNMITRIGGHACDRFCEDRDTGALELILSTRVAVRQMVAGEFAALRRHLLPPLLVLIPLLFLAWYLSLGGIDRLSELFTHGEDPRTYRLRALGITAGLASFLFIDAITLAWMAMWSSLFVRKSEHARPLSFIVALFGSTTLYAALVAVIDNISFYQSILREASFWAIFLSFALLRLFCNLGLVIDCRRRLHRKDLHSAANPPEHTRDVPAPFAFVTRLKSLLPRAQS